jgi:hypothetical protein
MWVLSRRERHERAAVAERQAAAPDPSGRATLGDRADRPR